MDTEVVIYDACVLYPAPLRDTLMSLAVTRLFRARWSEAIHDEWIRNLHDARPDLSLSAGASITDSGRIFGDAAAPGITADG